MWRPAQYIPSKDAELDGRQLAPQLGRRDAPSSRAAPDTPADRHLAAWTLLLLLVAARQSEQCITTRLLAPDSSPFRAAAAPPAGMGRGRQLTPVDQQTPGCHSQASPEPSVELSHHDSTLSAVTMWFPSATCNTADLSLLPPNKHGGGQRAQSSHFKPKRRCCLCLCPAVHSQLARHDSMEMLSKAQSCTVSLCSFAPQTSRLIDKHKATPLGQMQPQCPARTARLQVSRKQLLCQEQPCSPVFIVAQ